MCLMLSRAIVLSLAAVEDDPEEIEGVSGEIDSELQTAMEKLQQFGVGGEPPVTEAASAKDSAAEGVITWNVQPEAFTT